MCMKTDSVIFLVLLSFKPAQRRIYSLGTKAHARSVGFHILELNLELFTVNGFLNSLHRIARGRSHQLRVLVAASSFRTF
jgi:hypothetical protein